jgi:CDP-diacylglycerol pyrophosphatase
LRAKSLSLCAASIAAAVFAIWALDANRNALRQIVQDQCLAHWLQRHDPAPCERMDLAGPPEESRGYALLADRNGGAHFLLIPIRSIAGIESPELLQPGAPNYFAAAWQSRDRLAAVVGHSVPRSAVGLAVNPVHARTQEQLQLQGTAARITNTWSPIEIGGSGYNALRIGGEDLNGANPFELLAELMPRAKHAMGDYTLVVAGMQFENGPGFVLLAGRSRAGELLLDSTCAIAGA